MRDISIPVQRLLALRQQPGFADVDLAELATMAENLVETSFRAGTIVATPTGRVPALHLIVDGRFESGSAGWDARQVFGVLEVFAGRAVAEPVVAAVDTRTLQLAASDLAEILEDNYGLLSNTRRGIARYLLSKRVGRTTWQRPQQVVAPYRHPGLVERLIVLRHQLPFGRMQALAALAQSAVEVSWQPGEIIRSAGDPADGAFVLLDGSVRGLRGSSEHVLVPNDMIGMLETLAERDHGMTTIAATPVRALRIPAVALVDVMEDHTDLGLGMITQLAGEVLDHVAEPSSSTDRTERRGDLDDVVAVDEPELGSGDHGDLDAKRGNDPTIGARDRHGLAVSRREDLDRARLRVDDPDLLDADAGVERQLVSTLVMRRQHFDDERGRTFDTTFRVDGFLGDDEIGNPIVRQPFDGIEDAGFGDR